MSDKRLRFVDRSGQNLETKLDLWPSLVVRKETIDAEVERLADLAVPENGRREALIVHPNATEPGLGLAPGIQVTLSVLKPGESTKPFRHNATEVNFCIRGSGHTMARDIPSSAASASPSTSMMYGIIPPTPSTGTSTMATDCRCASPIRTHSCCRKCTSISSTRTRARWRRWRTWATGMIRGARAPTARSISTTAAPG